MSKSSRGKSAPPTASVPKSRRRKSSSSKARLDPLKMVRESLDATLTSPVDGRRISKRELAIISLVNRFATTGDAKTFKTLVDLLGDHRGPEVIYDDPPSDVRMLGDNEVFDVMMAFWDETFGLGEMEHDRSQ